MARLEGQVLVITGGASGLGQAIVERFVAEGASAAVLDRSESGLERLRDHLGDRVAIVSGDVRKPADVARAVTAAVDTFGHLDVAIGNAGLWDYSRKLDDIPSEDLPGAFDELFGVNVLGYMTLAKAALPHLVRSRGSMIFTVSNAGFAPGGGGVLYTASKHAVVGLIRQLAYEFAPAVRVNGVAPGPMHTQLSGPATMGLEDRHIDELDLPGTAGRNLAIGRVPELAEYAGAFVHLASRTDAAPTTGDVLQADCGIGIRGLGIPAAGGRLLEKYGAE